MNRDLSFNLLARRSRRNMEHRQRSPPGMGKWLLQKKQRRTDVRLNPACEAEALFRTRTGDPLLTMEVQRRYRRTRAVTRGQVCPANKPLAVCGLCPRVTARVLADVPVSYLRPVVCS